MSDIEDEKEINRLGKIINGLERERDRLKNGLIDVVAYSKLFKNQTGMDSFYLIANAALSATPSTPSTPKKCPECERLRAALKMYGSHGANCDYDCIIPYCTCGLDAALSETETKKGGCDSEASNGDEA